MSIYLKCPHCGEMGDKHPHVMTELTDPQIDESGIMISAQRFQCGLCGFTSPTFVHVKNTDWKWGEPTGRTVHYFVDSEGAPVEFLDFSAAVERLERGPPFEIIPFDPPATRP